MEEAYGKTLIDGEEAEQSEEEDVSHKKMRYEPEVEDAEMESCKKPEPFFEVDTHLEESKNVSPMKSIHHDNNHTPSNNPSFSQRKLRSSR
jgi:hypothetical protein